SPLGDPQRPRSRSRFTIHDSTTFEFPHGDPETSGTRTMARLVSWVTTRSLVSKNDKQPLGVVHLEEVVRAQRPQKGSSSKTAKQKRSGSETVRDPNRESRRWNRGFAAAQERLQEAEVIPLADREGDNYDLFAQALTDGCRLAHRRVQRSDQEPAAGTSTDSSKAGMRCLRGFCSLFPSPAKYEEG